MRKLLLFSILAASLFLVFWQSMQAAPGESKQQLDVKGLQQAAQELNQTKFSTAQAFIGQIIKALTAFIGTIFLALMVYAGILWTTSTGNAEQLDKAKNIFTWSAMGIVVMLASYILVSTLFGLLK